MNMILAMRSRCTDATELPACGGGLRGGGGVVGRFERSVHDSQWGTRYSSKYGKVSAYEVLVLTTLVPSITIFGRRLGYYMHRFMNKEDSHHC